MDTVPLSAQGTLHVVSFHWHTAKLQIFVLHKCGTCPPNAGLQPDIHEATTCNNSNVTAGVCFLLVCFPLSGVLSDQCVCKVKQKSEKWVWKCVEVYISWQLKQNIISWGSHTNIHQRENLSLFNPISRYPMLGCRGCLILLTETGFQCVNKRL